MVLTCSYQTFSYLLPDTNGLLNILFSMFNDRINWEFRHHDFQHSSQHSSLHSYIYVYIATAREAKNINKLFSLKIWNLISMIMNWSYISCTCYKRHFFCCGCRRFVPKTLCKQRIVVNLSSDLGVRGFFQKGIDLKPTLANSEHEAFSGLGDLELYTPGKLRNVLKKGLLQ